MYHQSTLKRSGVLGINLRLLKMAEKKQHSVFTRLAGMQLISVCVSLLIIGVLFGWLLQKYYSGAREWNLIEQGNRIVGILHEDIVNGDLNRVRQRIYTLSQSSGIDLWIIGAQGNIVAGSWLEQEDHTLTLDASEVEHVLAGNNITKKVMGPNYQNLLIVQAIYPEINNDNDQTIGALAMRAPLGGVGETINSVMRLVVIAGIVAGIIVFGISLSMAKAFAKPLEQLKHAAISPITWIVGGVLIVLVAVGIILAKVKSNKDKEEVRKLMAEMQEK